MIFSANKESIKKIYYKYLKFEKRKFWKIYLIVLIYIPKIFFWDRFVTRNSGIVDRMIYKHYNLRMSVCPEIPQINYGSKKIGFSAKVQLSEPVYKGGNVTLYELYIISSMVNYYQPKTVLEIGTFDGRTTLNLAINAPRDAKIYTIDLPLEKRAENYKNIDLRFEKKQNQNLFQNKIKKLYGDSTSYNFEFLKGKIDAIFIDGNHSYDFCLKDSDIAMNLINKDNGVILWHDYLAWDGVTIALNEIYRKYKSSLSFYHIKNTSLVVLKFESNTS